MEPNLRKPDKNHITTRLIKFNMNPLQAKYICYEFGFKWSPLPFQIYSKSRGFGV